MARPPSEMEREKLYRALPDRYAADFLDGLPDALYLLDHDGRFTYVNRLAGQYWNRDRAGLIGKQIWEAFPQVADSDVRRMHQRATAEQRPVRFETRSPVLDSWIYVTIRPLASGLGVCFRKIAQRHRLGRVLVVEDQDQVRGLLQVTLEQEGYLVLIADDLDAAKAAVTVLPTDIVLVDDRLPGGRGSMLQEQAARGRLPLLVMSGHPATMEQLDGTPNFIAKPFRVSQLLQRLSDLLASSQ